MIVNSKKLAIFVAMILRVIHKVVFLGVIFWALFPTNLISQHVSLSTVDYEPLTVRDRRVGVKTNLMYDAASLVNLGVDYSIGSHWSVSAEGIFPWWNSWDNRKTTEMLSLGLELRYYWRSWANDLDYTMSGPFVGVSANGGICDLARDFKGVQSDSFFVLGGAVLGYTFYLDKWWRMNIEAGIGALYIPYQHYHVINEGEDIYSHEVGKYRGIAPTKLELSFVYLFSQHWQKK